MLFPCSVRFSRQIAIPQIDINAICRWRVRPPEFDPGEAHAVHMLRAFPEPLCIAVGQDEQAVITVHDAAATADVSGHAGVCIGVPIQHLNAISRNKTRGITFRPSRRCAATECGSDLVCFKPRHGAVTNTVLPHGRKFRLR